jgi:Phospholipase_D-nuclease N-terminal
MRIWLTVFLLGFNLYAFFDCARTDQALIRRGPKWGWLLGIFLVEVIGSISWFIWGRPRNNNGPRLGKKKIIPPDDDPDFLRKI